MDVRFLDGKINISDYNPSFMKDKDGKVIAVSFPIDDFFELMEDMEDNAYLEAIKEEKIDTTPHAEIIREAGLTPEKLREIRKEMGLTADQLGEKIGYSGGTIRNIESGQNKITERFERAVRSVG
jgi:DNA-binding transcriptional regulator YiaG